MDRDHSVALPEERTYRHHGAIPAYLKRHYWWAYVHPRAVQVFDRGWLINCILLGNYRRLVREALVEFDGPHFARILQIACVYGDLTPRIAQAAA